MHQKRWSEEAGTSAEPIRNGFGYTFREKRCGTEWGDRLVCQISGNGVFESVSRWLRDQMERNNFQRPIGIEYARTRWVEGAEVRDFRVPFKVGRC